MKKLLAVVFLGLACVSSNAHAWWFFFFIPGGMLTGSQASADKESTIGDRCVNERAKVGEVILGPKGEPMIVSSLLGKSEKCKASEFPILAMLEPSKEALHQSSSKARIEIPDDWESQPLTPLMKAHGGVLYAVNKMLDVGMLLSTTKKTDISDMQAYANSRKASQAGNLKDAKESATTAIHINGLPAWRFEIDGKSRAGHPVTYWQTLVESVDEVVTLNFWAPSLTPEKKIALAKIVDTLTGLSPPSVSSSVRILPTSPDVGSVKRDTQPSPMPLANPTGEKGDVANRLRELNALYKDGVITKQEFDAKKKALLDLL